MNLLAILAVFTLGISVAVLRASFEDLRAAPFALDITSAQTAPRTDEDLRDADLVSADPIGAWLDRYLTPPAQSERSGS
jgi:hypothetical protein